MKGYVLRLCCAFLFLTSCGSLRAGDLDNFYKSSVEHIFTNLNHPDIKAGAVIASPSKFAPDYFSHWTRDAALVQNALYEAYPSANDELKTRLREQALKWLNFEIDVQKTSLTAVAGIGEPRFYVDGSVVTFPWARPQDDGPAGRALAAMQWAEILMQHGLTDFVKEKLYRPNMPADTLIKRDLEYIAGRWSQPSFDIWEEINGTHFFTRVIQLVALKKGAIFAAKMGDSGAADWYSKQAAMIRNEMTKFLVDGRDYVSATVNWVGGWNHKKTELDMSVFIAANHGLFDEEFLAKYKNYFYSSARRLENFFAETYAINRDHPDLATALGRYPEDVYTGTTTDGPANAWFITTHAMAEFYCKLARLETQTNPTNAASLKEKGRKFFERTLRHKDAENMLSEQYSRDNGGLMGAKSLTWSYASYMTAYLACQ